MNVFAILGADHAVMRQILGELEQAPQPDDDGVALVQTVQGLVAVACRHETVEDMVLRPAVRRTVPGAAALENLGARHHGRLTHRAHLSNCAQSFHSREAPPAFALPRSAHANVGKSIGTPPRAGASPRRQDAG